MRREFPDRAGPDGDGPSSTRPKAGPPAPAVRDRYAAASAALVAILTILRFLYALTLEAHPDEAYYVAWSRRLDYGYFDQPPLLAWLLAGFSWLLGSATLAIRVMPALLSAWASSYAFRLGRETCGGRVAFWAVAVMNVTPLFTAGAMLATMDTPMVLFLSGASYYFYLGLARGQTRFWALAGLFTGLALLSKYVAALVVVSFFLFLLLSEHRAWLKRRQPWLALLLALLVFSPQLAWNYAHGWVSFAFQWEHGLGAGRFPRWLGVPEYLVTQAGVVGPVLFGLFVAALVAVVRGWRREPAGRRFLWCLAIVPAGFFMCTSVVRRVEANWPCFAYVPGILLAVNVFEGWLGGSRPWRACWRLNWAWSAAVLGTLLLFIHVPFLQVRHDRGAEFFGWNALGAEAASLSREHPGVGLAANRYQLASELELYSGMPVTCLGIQRRPSQYSLWQDTSDVRGRTYLFFHDRRLEDAGIAGGFASHRPVRTLNVRGRGGRVLRQMFVYEVVLPR